MTAATTKKTTSSTRTTKKKIEVGQVWRLGNRLVMVSFLRSRSVMVGDATRRGSSYALVSSPAPISPSALRRGTCVFDTEAA